MPQKCPACESIYGDSPDICPRDGAELAIIDPDEDPLIGEVIDERFRLEQLLGAGGMGRVYRGVQLSIDRDVAVKLLRDEAVPDRSREERFIREARVISGFKHPNIVRLIDFGKDTEREFPYLAMELAGGVSLGRLLAEARLRPDLAVEIARQICSALVEAHNAGIVHRDLKPDNLHLLAQSDGSFHAKLLDFGIAFPQESTTNLTETGMMCGTATYIAPEQARGLEVDGQADLYSLGVILFEMVTGVPPFQGESGFEIVRQQVEDTPPDPTQYVSPETLNAELVDLVYDLLAKEPHERPDGAGAVRDRLEAIAETLDFGSLQLDASRSGKDLFEPFLLPQLPDDAPIHESDTLGEADGMESPVDSGPGTSPTTGTPPTAGPSEASETGTDPPVRDGRTRFADSHRSSDVQTSETDGPSDRSGYRRLLMTAVTIAASGLAGALVLAAYLNWGPDGDPAPDERATTTTATADTGTAGDTDGLALTLVDGPLEEYAGRCTVIGESDAEFHTVYMYPAIGELVRRGNDHLSWSSLEIRGRSGDEIHFDYGRSRDSGDDVSSRGAVDKSADKRFFSFPDHDRFVCRHESYPDYYGSLDLEGEFEAEDDRRLAFSGDAQQFDLTEDAPDDDAGEGASTTYAYRLLDGEPEGDEWTLAVRPTSDSSAPWTQWTLRRDESSVTLIRDGTETTFSDPDADSPNADADPEPSPDPEPTPTPEPSSDDNRRVAANARPDTEPSPNNESSSDDSAAPGPAAAASDEPSSAGGESAGFTEEEAEEFRENFESRGQTLVDKCRETVEGIQTESERLKNVAERDIADDEKDKIREEAQEKLKTYQQRLQKLGDKQSRLLRKANMAGVAPVRIRMLSGNWVSCYDPLN